MKVGSHSVEARKLAFFVGEQAILFGAFVGAALAAGRSLGLEVPARAALFVEAAAATLVVQTGLYMADLYDFKVAFHDAPRAMRLLKALGAGTIVCGIGMLLMAGALPRPPPAGGRPR